MVSMGGGITVSGGGTVAVSTPAIIAQAARLDDLQRELHRCSGSLRAIDRGVGAGEPPGSADAARAIDDARVLLAQASGWVALLAAGLRAGAETYGVGEHGTASLAQSLAAQWGMAFGEVLGFAAAVAGPALAAAAVGVSAPALAVGALAAANPRTGAALGLLGRRFVLENRGILSDPRFIDLVRTSVMTGDDVAGGVTQPPALLRLLGDEGLGIRGLDTTAAGLAAAGGAVGVLRETPVSVKVAATSAAVPAMGYVARAARIPEGTAQVRIDRYQIPGRPDRFEVYIGGTRDFSPTATDEPWDITSNVAGASLDDSGAYRAVEEALRDAGADARSPLVITGYSLGGSVGAALAASGDHNVQGLLTLGAPAGQVVVPASVPWVALEHNDDLLPALGGTRASLDPVIVSRLAMGDGADGGTGADAGAGAGRLDEIFPAHDLDRYRDTAALAEGSTESRLRAARDALDTVGAGAERVESMWFVARRTPPGKGTVE